MLERRVAKSQVMTLSEEYSATGVVVSILIAGAAIAFALSVAALAVYRRAVTRLMRTRSRPDNPGVPPLFDRSHRTGSVSDYLTRFSSPSLAA